jgi:hypothetical protein
MSFVEISDTLYENLLTMEKQKLLELMLEALDCMQAYNGQSVTSAILTSTGAEFVEDDDGRTFWHLPKDFWKKNADLVS